MQPVRQPRMAMSPQHALSRRSIPTAGRGARGGARRDEVEDLLSGLDDRLIRDAGPYDAYVIERYGLLGCVSLWRD